MQCPVPMGPAVLTVGAVEWGRQVEPGLFVVQVRGDALSPELRRILEGADCDGVQRDRGVLYKLLRPSCRRVPLLPILPPL